MKDALKIFHEFGNAVLHALNVAQVVPCGNEGDCCAVMVIVGQPDCAPLAGSLNYDRERRLWSLDAEVDMAEKVRVLEEPST